VSEHLIGCVLCQWPIVRAGKVEFSGTEKTPYREVTFELSGKLCQKCTNQLFKHLKRMIPKRLMVRGSH